MTKQKPLEHSRSHEVALILAAHWRTVRFHWEGVRGLIDTGKINKRTMEEKNG